MAYEDCKRESEEEEVNLPVRRYKVDGLDRKSVV